MSSVAASATSANFPEMTTPRKIDGFQKLAGATFGSPSPSKLGSAVIKFVDGKRQFNNETTEPVNKLGVATKEDIMGLQSTINEQSVANSELLKGLILKIDGFEKLADTMTKVLEQHNENNAKLWSHCLEDRETLEKHQKQIDQLKTKEKQQSTTVKYLEGKLVEAEERIKSLMEKAEPRDANIKRQETRIEEFIKWKTRSRRK